MRYRYDQRRQGPDRGFTLIELLVVVIIIGILATIAIPVFLSQRKKGWDAQAKSDLRNVASLQEVFASDCSYYAGAVTPGKTPGTCATGITNYAKSPNVSTLTVPKLYDASNAAIAAPSASTTTGVNGFCLKAHSASGSDFFYDSTKGGMQPGSTTSCRPFSPTRDSSRTVAVPISPLSSGPTGNAGQANRVDIRGGARCLPESTVGSRSGTRASRSSSSWSSSSSSESWPPSRFRSS